MKAIFVEMSSFEKYRPRYLTDVAYGLLQQELLADPRKGNTISGTRAFRQALRNEIRARSLL